MNEHSDKRGNEPSQPSQPSQHTSDLSDHDMYFVCLHVANLVVTAEAVGVAPRVRNRLQRILDELIAEYDSALKERNELRARFES